MSRIGRAPIPIPDGVTVNITGQTVTVKGPKGELRHTVVEPIRVAQEDGTLVVTRPTDRGPHRALHGLSRSLVANMVAGRQRRLRAPSRSSASATARSCRARPWRSRSATRTLLRSSPPTASPSRCPAPTQVVVRGIDKQAVGEIAAQIRAVRPPEPYKGKGIRYAGEAVRRKVGKSA